MTYQSFPKKEVLCMFACSQAECGYFHKSVTGSIFFFFFADRSQSLSHLQHMESQSVGAEHLSVLSTLLSILTPDEEEEGIYCVIMCIQLQMRQYSVITNSNSEELCQLCKRADNSEWFCFYQHSWVIVLISTTSGESVIW